MAKRNPILDAFERKKEQEFSLRRKAHEEIRMLAVIIAADDAEAPAGEILEGYLEVKETLARDMLEDLDADREMVYTRYDLARRVKKVLGKEKWMRYRELFPLLQEFREWEERDG